MNGGDINPEGGGREAICRGQGLRLTVIGPKCLLNNCLCAQGGPEKMVAKAVYSGWKAFYGYCSVSIKANENFFQLNVGRVGPWFSRGLVL